MRKLHWIAAVLGGAMGWIQKIKNSVLERSKYLPDLLAFSFREAVAYFKLPCWREKFSLNDKVAEVLSCSEVFWVPEVQTTSVWFSFIM